MCGCFWLWDVSWLTHSITSFACGMILLNTLRWTNYLFPWCNPLSTAMTFSPLLFLFFTSCSFYPHIIIRICDLLIFVFMLFLWFIWSFIPSFTFSSWLLPSLLKFYFFPSLLPLLHRVPLRSFAYEIHNMLHFTYKRYEDLSLGVWA